MKGQTGKHINTKHLLGYSHNCPVYPNWRALLKWSSRSFQKLSEASRNFQKPSRRFHKLPESLPEAIRSFQKLPSSQKLLKAHTLTSWSIKKFQNIYISHRSEGSAPRFISFGFNRTCFMTFPDMTAGPPGAGRHVGIAMSRCGGSQKQKILVPTLPNEPKNEYFEISSRME